MYRLTRKLSSVKTRLKAFNFHVFANVWEKVVEARKTLYRAQTDLLSNPNDSGCVGKEKVCLKNFHDLARAKEGFLKKKSRIQWLKLGDQNSNFFHKAVKARNSRNSIKSITLENGCRSEDPATIIQEFVKHFQSVLGGNMQDRHLLSTTWMVWFGPLSIWIFLIAELHMRRSRDPCSLSMTQRPLVPMGSLSFFSKGPGPLLGVR